MKKYVTATLVSIAVLGTFTGCGSKDIGKDKATEIALEDAGLSESEVTRLRVSKDSDDGRTLYEVEFTESSTEYDYEILASNGDILKADFEEINQLNSQNRQDQQAQSGQQGAAGQNEAAQDSSIQDNAGQDSSNQNNNAGQDSSGQNNNAGQGSSGQNNSNQASVQNNVQITQEEAAKLALDRVPGASESDLKIKLDYDDGSYKYEGDIIYGGKEYEFEIDANTGDFLEWSEERR